MKKIITLLALFSIAAFTQEQGTLTDSRDKKEYKTLKIGKQTWMAENLNHEAKGSKCYDNKPDNCQKYGRLYDWKTAKAACPKGWHLPSNDEWHTLVNFAGGDEIAGKKLKSKSGWSKNGNGTDAFGFSALPGGFWLTMGQYGGFADVGNSGGWWDSDGVCPTMSESMDMGLIGEGESEGALLSVRCLKD